MYIISAIVLLTPALIGVLLYERFKGYELNLRKRFELFAVFTFFINLAGYAVLWLTGRGALAWGEIIETGSTGTSVFSVTFVVQYMGIALVVAVVLAYVLSLVRIEKSHKEPSVEEDESEKTEN